MNWKPIATAPKDGTRILIWVPYQGAITAAWIKKERRWVALIDKTTEACVSDVSWTPDGPYEYSASFYVWTPTHWMPLPGEPENADSSGS